MARFVRELHEAVLFDNLDDIVALVKDGADINQQDASNRTCLDCCVSLHATMGLAREVAFPPEAAQKGAAESDQLELRLKKAKLLLDNGANPNVPDKQGWTVVHQCARNGDLSLLELCVRKGGNIHLRTSDNELAVDIAANRRHVHVVQYLERQSCDLKALCRLAIREAMGKRTYNRINELPIPPMMKLYLNHGNPFQGWKATLIPPSPWSDDELHSGLAKPQEVKSFICENATEEFLENHEDLGTEDLQGLVSAFQSLYLWEAFKTSVDFEEQAARAPRYSMKMVERKEDDKSISNFFWKLLGQ